MLIVLFTDCRDLLQYFYISYKILFLTSYNKLNGVFNNKYTIIGKIGVGTYSSVHAITMFKGQN